MKKEAEHEDLTVLRTKAHKALIKAKALDIAKENSREYEWVQVDSRTRVYKRKNSK